MGIAKNIKVAAKDKDMTQKDIAEALGVPLQNLYNQLHRDAFTVRKAAQIADALNCDIVLIDRETKKIY